MGLPGLICLSCFVSVNELPSAQAQICKLRRCRGELHTRLRIAES